MVIHVGAELVCAGLQLPFFFHTGKDTKQLKEKFVLNEAVLSQKVRHIVQISHADGFGNGLGDAVSSHLTFHLPGGENIRRQGNDR